MSKENKEIRVKWGKLQEIIPFAANAFKITYNNDGVTLNIGLLDPEDLLPENIEESDGNVDIQALARFQLSPTSFYRLKKEIEELDKILREGNTNEENTDA